MSSTSTAQAEPAPAPARGPERLAPLGGRLTSPAGGAVLVVILFVAITLWWVLTDVRDVNNDNARHLLIASTWSEYIGRGDILGPFRGWVGYPPGVHLVGVAAMALAGGFKVPALVFAQNLVFVPLLALGIYGTAKIAFGRTAGLLAVLFALGAPLVMSMFHVFMLDAPEAAMVAVTVWLLLLSNRFERPGIAALAGLAAAVGMYTKPTFPVFVAGVVLVILLRGGWRHPKGVLAFVLVLAVLAGPWYVQHFDLLSGSTTGLVGREAGGEGGSPKWYGDVRYPERDELRNFAWYPWSLMNNTLYLPLTLFFLAGVGWSLWRLRRPRWRASVLPELLVGGAVGYLAISMIILKDPRYSLPCLVYIAVLAVGWVTTLPRRPRMIAIALLTGIVAFNSVTHNLGVGGKQNIVTAKAIRGNPIGEYTATVYRDTGYFEGPPVRTHAPFVKLLDDLHDELGVRRAVPHQPDFSKRPFSLVGTTVLVKGSKLELEGFTPAFVHDRRDAWIVRITIASVGRPPCVVTPNNDGTGLYVYLGRIPADYRTVTPDCP